jgi:5-bromo-4-chloroindolyl phosphate hydrolysis protein
MDGKSPVSPETLQTDLALELEQLKHELQVAEGKIMQLELALLQSRDFAIGAAAEASETPIIRAMYHTMLAESERKLGDANEHIKSHLAHIARLEQALADLLKIEKTNIELRSQLKAVHNSMAWRLGRTLLLPVRIIKRIVK